MMKKSLGDSLQAVKNAVNNRLQGRYGLDDLSGFLLGTVLLCLVLSRFRLLSFLAAWALAGLVWVVWRSLSRRFDRRQAENAGYLQLRRQARTAWAEWKTRAQNRGEYKYFRCSQCRRLLRVPRGRGKVQVTCPGCGRKMTRKC